MLRSCIKGFLRAKKLWVNPPKAERAKPSLSSDYNLLFKNKIGERSLDIHRHHDSFQRTFPIEIRFFLTLKNWPQLLAEASRALLTCFRFGQQ